MGGGDINHLGPHEHALVCRDARDGDDDKFVRSRDLLTTEARQFVTASKLFVKSATESEGQLVECLNHCVHMISRIGTERRQYYQSG